MLGSAIHENSREKITGAEFVYVQSITVDELNYLPETRHYEADFCLHMTARTGSYSSNAYLRGRVERRPKEGHDELAFRLLQDVRRQIGWMPEFRLGLCNLSFPSETKNSLAA